MAKRHGNSRAGPGYRMSGTSDFELNESWLRKVAGWKAVNAGKKLVRDGAVSGAVYQGRLAKGQLVEGRRRFLAGLKINGPEDVTNLCRCREATEWGALCSHSVAVGLVAGAAAAEPDVPKSGGKVKAGPAPRTAVDGELRLLLPAHYPECLNRRSVALRVVWTGESAAASRGQVRFPPLEQLNPMDQAPVGKLMEWGGGQVPSMMVLEKRIFLELAESLVGSTAFRTEDGTVVPVVLGSGEMVRVRVRVVAGEGVRLDWDRETVWVEDDRNRPVMMATSEHLKWIPEEVRDVVKELRVTEHWEGPSLVRLVGGLLPTVERYFVVEKPPDLERFLPPKGIPEIIFRVKGDLEQLEGRLEVMYEGRQVEAGEGELFTYYSQSGQSRLIRDIKQERKTIDIIRNIGFIREKNKYYARSEVAARFLYWNKVKNTDNQFFRTVFSSKKLSVSAGNAEVLSPKIALKPNSGGAWLEFDYQLVNQQGETFGAHEIDQLLKGSGRRDQRKLRLADTAQLHDLDEVLRDVNPEQLAPGHYRVPAIHADYVLGSFSLPPAKADLTPPDFGELAHVLRPYQKEGVTWLAAAAQTRGGGILADEMGLGKTLQILALLQDPAFRPALVVCPSVLIGNWIEETRRFTPGLVATALRTGRDFETLPEADLYVTSYALLRSSRFPSGWHPATVILDEAQHIKNPDTLNAKAARGLATDHRFVLTGTPVENSVRDLWSLMAFLAPGYLGSRKEFHIRYEKPIMEGSDAAARARLTRRMRPFFLRRTKDRVAGELPRKLVQPLKAAMTPAQASLYRQVLERGRAKISEGPEGRMGVLRLLLRLRQIACHPKLTGVETKEIPGKVELCLELMEELMDGGHRALVFSQFASMLRLMAAEFEARGWSYTYLDGQTRDRSAQIDRFRRDPDVPVFLISLKAGGFGLNLTEADTVIHFDPWWNPAVEAQANDRVHRIGQDKPVSIYKLVAEGTIEEKILLLQERKQALISAAVESEEPLMEGLSWKEMCALLEE